MKRELQARGVPRAFRVGVFAPLYLLGALALGGCDSLLEVSNPGAVDAADLADPALTRTLTVAALGKFECAVTQYALASGVFANEFWTSSGFRAVNAWSQRIEAARESNGGCGGTRGNVGMGAFFSVQQARTEAETAFSLISGFPDNTPAKTRSLAKTAAYAGYAYILLGEGFCAVPLDGGPIVPKSEIWRLAEERLNTAIQLGGQAGDTDIVRMATAGRARVKLNTGRLTEAAADASQIPQGWARYARHSTVSGGIRENRVWGVNNFSEEISVTTAYRGLTVDGVPDTRVPVQNTGRLGRDQETPLWIQLKFPAPDTPTPIASWEEAQLILAEALGGQEAVDAINRLRTQAELPLFQSTNPQEIQAQVIEERRRQLFAEGQRLGDMLRLDIPFPGPLDHQGATYGPLRCMPIPFSEENSNPNL